MLFAVQALDLIFFLMIPARKELVIVGAVGIDQSQYTWYCFSYRAYRLASACCSLAERLAIQPLKSPWP